MTREGQKDLVRPIPPMTLLHVHDLLHQLYRAMLLASAVLLKSLVTSKTAAAVLLITEVLPPQEVPPCPGYSVLLAN